MTPGVENEKTFTQVKAIFFQVLFFYLSCGRIRWTPCSNSKGFITSNSTTKISFFLKEKETESFCLLEKKKKDVTSKRIRQKLSAFSLASTNCNSYKTDVLLIILWQKWVSRDDYTWFWKKVINSSIWHNFLVKTVLKLYL